MHGVANSSGKNRAVRSRKESWKESDRSVGDWSWRGFPMTRPWCWHRQGASRHGAHWIHGDISVVHRTRRIEPQRTNFDRHVVPRIGFTGAETGQQHRGRTKSSLSSNNNDLVLVQRSAALKSLALLYWTNNNSPTLKSTNSLLMGSAESKSTKATKRPIQLPPATTCNAALLYHPNRQFLLGLKHFSGPSTVGALQHVDKVK